MHSANELIRMASNNRAAKERAAFEMKFTSAYEKRETVAPEPPPVVHKTEMRSPPRMPNRSGALSDVIRKHERSKSNIMRVNQT